MKKDIKVKVTHKDKTYTLSLDKLNHFFHQLGNTTVNLKDEKEARKYLKNIVFMMKYFYQILINCKTKI